MMLANVTHEETPVIRLRLSTPIVFNDNVAGLQLHELAILIVCVVWYEDLKPLGIA